MRRRKRPEALIGFLLVLSASAAVPGAVGVALAAVGQAAPLEPPAAQVEPPAAPSAAAVVPPAATPAVESPWRVMPIWGGDIRSLVVAPDDPDVVLAGTTTGQLYLSRDGGSSWSNAGAPLPFPGWVVSSLRWDPNRRGRLWVALWGIWGGGQVALSDNLGKSWAARAAGLPAEPVYSLALVPGSEGRIFAGTLSGVYGTENGGVSWERLTAAQPELQKVTSLVVDPNRPGTVIAGSWRQAYRSDDGGHTWAGIFDGMVLDTEVFSLTPIPEHPGEIWASSCGWVYQTVDRGDHWVRFKDGLDERRTLSFATLADGRFLAGTVSGLYASTDGGHTWKRISDPALSVSAIVTDPARPQRILLGTEGAGIWLSTDGGGDFFRSSLGLTATRVGALALVGNDLLVAVNDAGPVSGVYVSRDRGDSFTSDFSPLPTVLDLAVFGSRAYAATERGLYERRGVDWHRVAELGTERVEQLVVEEAPGPNGARLAVRTPNGIWDLVKGSFVRRPWKHGAPRSAAFYGGALWVTDAQGVYELTSDSNHTIASPLTGGRVYRLGEQLLLAGAGGAWLRSARSVQSPPQSPQSLQSPQSPPPAPPGGEEWIPLTGEASRLVPTGDSRFAALLVSGDTVRLYDRDRHKLSLLPVPVPGRDIAGALVMDGRLLLATSGYGVIVRDLER
jgi:photosystem II stability/assembly factor-like uncharacterized protein